MKTKQKYFGHFKILIASIIVCAIAITCNKTEMTPVEPDDAVSNNELIDVEETLNQIDVESGILLVENGNSIQDAIDASIDGDIIYIEPGLYDESISIEKPNITLIGLDSSEGDQVIIKAIERANAEIYNISLLNGEIVSQLKHKRRSHRCMLRKMTREILGDDIAHYTFEIINGNGVYDVVKVHRIVKERRAYRPIRTCGDVFMVHGAIQDFDDIFLTAGATVINAQTSAPFYLASRGIDVWGIDLAWNMVPMECTDFSFMEGWGVEKDIDHTLRAMSIARLIRALSGQGFGKMNLLGFSYGVSVAYGASGAETQIKKVCRDIKGIIPVDSQIKGNDPDFIANNCADAELQMGLINEGMHHNPWGVGLIQLGIMALAAPDEASPVPDFAGLTNLQVMNAIGSDHGAGWHFLGGNPFELNYTDPMRFVRLSVELAPYMPRQMFYEMAASGCPDLDVSFDDYLTKIKLPILYISAEGSDSSDPDYTSSLTKSKDIQRIHVDDPAMPTEVDFGHADIWMAKNAKQMVWSPLYDWLVDHSKKHR